MGRENYDPTVVHSSIALLQERFKQLQRVKEMREERELLKMLAEPAPAAINSINNVKQFNNNPTNYYTKQHRYEPPRTLFLHNCDHLVQLQLQQRSSSTTPAPQVSLSLSHTLQSRSSFEIERTPLLMKLDTPSSNSNLFEASSSVHESQHSVVSRDENSDVDTSLHL